MRYVLPLTALTALVRPCVDIALYYLAHPASVLTDEIRQRYEDAAALVRRFGDGRARLAIDTDGDSKGEAGPAVITMNQPNRIFNRTTLRDL